MDERQRKEFRVHFKAFSKFAVWSLVAAVLFIGLPKLHEWDVERLEER